MKKITLLFTAALLSFGAQAQLLYSFDSVKTTSGLIDPTPVPAAGPSLTCGSFSAVGTSANSSAAMRFDFANWPLGSVGGTGDTLFSGMTGSMSSTEYYEVTLTPNPGFSITADSIKFNFERSGTGVRTYAVRSSLDGYSSNLTAVYGAPTTNVNVQAGNIFFLKKDITTPQNRNIILPGAAFANLTAPVTFRFYAWNAEGTGGTFSIDNVLFIGSSAPAAGIAEKSSGSVSVYPSPSSNGVFTADLGSLNGKSLITVYNIIGKKILSREAAEGIQTLDLSAEANGSYFITIKTEKELITKKIIINK
jgi:hypothetical protein